MYTSEAIEVRKNIIDIGPLIWMTLRDASLQQI